jgi:hypothetical protein
MTSLKYLPYILQAEKGGSSLFMIRSENFGSFDGHLDVVVERGWTVPYDFLITESEYSMENSVVYSRS